MKHSDPDLHLTDDELLRATIDPSDLGPARKAHFESCPHCRRQTEDLAQGYSRLGQMATQMAPKPQKTFRVPAHNAPVSRWYFKPGLALGVSAALVLVFTLWGPRFTPVDPTPTPMVVQKFENDNHLLEEVDMLVENALPEKYQQVAALSDDRSVEDLDEFIDWVVPPIEEINDVDQPTGTFI
ncbi:MAG: hypothetical protein GY697_23080 [Desulfobacterales bacterium]|nr:hypothetical protein [Desulfobacterales bacterium]